MQSDGFNSTLSPVVYGDNTLSINTQYNTMVLCTNFTILAMLHHT